MAKDSIRGIAFDFGNTLCPWDEEQYWHVTRSTVIEMCRRAPNFDLDAAVEMFVRARREGYAQRLPRMEENDLVGTIARTAAKICGRPLRTDELQEVVDAHVRSFVEACKAPEGLREFLDRLSRRYKLAVVSNYPLSDCIRRSLKELGIAECFRVIIVSGDLGVIKPSKVIFDRLVSDMGMPAESVLLVGDDWVADVVGACAFGMPCVQIVSDDDGRKPRTLDGVFGVYLRKALESPDLSRWREARPLATLKSVLDLERWLEDRVE